MADPTRIKITALDATRNAFRSVTRGLKGITGAVFSLKTGLVGLAGIGGFGLLIKSSLQSIDTLGKTASKLGVTTKELGALRYAAEISGVEIRTVDMATQRFTRRLAEAANGTGEAKGALKELNIDASKLAKLPLQEQMLQLSNAFQNVENSADEVRLAFKLFDSEGVGLVNVLKLGSNELRNLFQEADDLGILLSGKAVQGVEKANDAILKLSKLFKGITDQTMAALAPALEHLATVLKDDILDSIKGSNESVSAFGRTLAGEFLESIKQVIIGFQTFLNSQEEIDLINKFDFESHRLGKIISNIKKVEPIFRDTNFLSVDFKSLKSSELNFAHNFPNGFSSREMCSIFRYAGMSNKLSVLGLFEILNSKISGALLSQCLWYFIEGYSYRMFEDPKSKKFKGYSYNLITEETNLKFYNSELTQRWWVELLDENKKPITKDLYPCSESDYKKAVDEILSQRLLMLLRRNFI